MEKYTEPNYRSSALIAIDTQFDTLDGQPLEIAGTSAALPNIRALLDAYRQHGLPIIHIVRIYKPDGSNVDLCRKQAVEEGAAILLAGSAGCELAPDLFSDDVRLDSDLLLSGRPQKISENEVIIYKPRWGAFFNTPLESLLKLQDIDTLVFTGCNFPNCPRTSIYEASERDYKIVLAEDAVSGLYPKGKEEMSNIGVHLLKTASIESAIMNSRQDD
ncbi:MAG: cysteine hydrolase [Gammaproteobacteria bacterium]|nr:cysteine hydrolase [Gammaproteobacteria bacterium]MBU1775163.1 cysteine hydrolase [Gammaproteobacteria bacterium]MBU1969673.1 cysteine hydrolase [Gammaproteobacteria bacterium]